MTIKTDRSDVPFPQRPSNRAPVQAPIFAPILARAWLTKYAAVEDNIDKPHAIADRVFRASWASKRCDRSLQYAMERVPQSQPTSLADYWRFGLGQMVHEYLQDVFPTAFANSASEIKVDLRRIGLNGSASVAKVDWSSSRVRRGNLT